MLFNVRSGEIWPITKEDPLGGERKREKKTLISERAISC